MRALVLVDIQNDFLPGGALAVPDGDQVIPPANRLAQRMELVVATQDWHPPDHASFATRHPGRQPFETIDLQGQEQILWPPHCIQKSRGAEFAPELQLDLVDHVIQKGQDPNIDSYSGFLDNAHRRDTGLDTYLRGQGVDTVLVCGLALDVCVRYTVLDAIRLGYRTQLVEDAVRAVEQQPGDGVRALEACRQAGAEIVREVDVPGR